MNQIILVSEDRELCKLLKFALRETPIKVTHEVSSPKMAADLFAQNPLALVVLDYFIPASSGLDTLKLLKRMNEEGLFMLITRMRMRDILERAFRMGAQDVIHYPISAEILRDTILHRLQGRTMSAGEDSHGHTPKLPRKNKEKSSQ
jgi:DNA-binding response OmpR family regulator